LTTIHQNAAVIISLHPPSWSLPKSSHGDVAASKLVDVEPGECEAIGDAVATHRAEQPLQTRKSFAKHLYLTRSEMTWKCDTHAQNEWDSGNYYQLPEIAGLLTDPSQVQLPSVPWSIDHDYTDQNIDDFLRAKDRKSKHWIWRRVVEGHSERSTTSKPNKLDSISAFARLAAKRLECTFKDSYLAGLWKESLVQDMLWISSDPLAAHPAEMLSAPSWSWVSAPGPVSYFFAEFQFNFEELIQQPRSFGSLKSKDTVEAVSRRSIEITGLFQEVVLSVEPVAWEYRRPTYGSRGLGSGPLSTLRVFVCEDGEAESHEMILDRQIDSGTYADGYCCLVLGANVDKFRGSRRMWFLVMKANKDFESNALPTFERVGIGYTTSEDSWLWYASFETVLII